MRVVVVGVFIPTAPILLVRVARVVVGMVRLGLELQWPVRTVWGVVAGLLGMVEHLLLVVMAL
jgi:hypothetical protein